MERALIMVVWGLISFCIFTFFWMEGPGPAIEQWLSHKSSSSSALWMAWATASSVAACRINPNRFLRLVLAERSSKDIFLEAFDRLESMLLIDSISTTWSFNNLADKTRPACRIPVGLIRPLSAAMRSSPLHLFLGPESVQQLNQQSVKTIPFVSCLFATGCVIALKDHEFNGLTCRWAEHWTLNTGDWIHTHTSLTNQTLACRANQWGGP